MATPLLEQLRKHVSPMSNVAASGRAESILFKRFRPGTAVSFAGRTSEAKLAQIQRTVEEWAHANRGPGIELTEARTRGIDSSTRVVRLSLTGLFKAEEQKLKKIWRG